MCLVFERPLDKHDGWAVEWDWLVSIIQLGVRKREDQTRILSSLSTQTQMMYHTLNGVPNLFERLPIIQLEPERQGAL